MSNQKLGYEILMELPLLKRLARRCEKEDVDDEVSPSGDSDDGDANTSEEEEQDKHSTQTELQQVFLAKLFLCSLSVEKLAHGAARSEIKELYKRIPFRYPGFRESEWADDLGGYGEKGELQPSAAPNEYSANSPPRRRSVEENAIDRQRLNNDLRRLKRKTMDDSSPSSPLASGLRASPPKLNQVPLYDPSLKRTLSNEQLVLPEVTPKRRLDSDISFGVAGLPSERTRANMMSSMSPNTLGRKTSKSPLPKTTDTGILEGSASPTATDSPSPPPILQRKSSSRGLTLSGTAETPLSPPLLLHRKSSSKTLITSTGSESQRELPHPDASGATTLSIEPHVGDISESKSISRAGSQKVFDLNQERDEDSEPLNVRRHSRDQDDISTRATSPSSHVLQRKSSMSAKANGMGEKKQSKKTMSLLERHSAEYLAKEVKREALMELVTFVKENGLEMIPNKELCLAACVEMTRRNLFRKFSPPPNERLYLLMDSDDDTPILDPRWPHISVVYEFILRFLSSRGFGKAHIDAEFCVKLIDLFHTEDPRERDYLKNTLHRIYGAVPTLRPLIRKELQSTFDVFVNERRRHIGVLELLEVVGSIVSGFSVPLKREHIEFYLTGLLPLHRADSILLFHNQLSYCVSQMVEKENSTIVEAVQAIRQYFPWNAASKQLLFLNELEELMEIFLRGESGMLVGRRLQHRTGKEQSASLMSKETLNSLLENVAFIVEECLRSEHFQVVERALFLWNSDQLATRFFKSSLPHMKGIFQAVEKDRLHWNGTVRTLAEEVAQLYRDDEYYEESTALSMETERRKRREFTERQRMWSILQERVDK